MDDMVKTPWMDIMLPYMYRIEYDAEAKKYTYTEWVKCPRRFVEEAIEHVKAVLAPLGMVIEHETIEDGIRIWYETDDHFIILQQMIQEIFIQRNQDKFQESMDILGKISRDEGERTNQEGENE